MGLSVGCNRRQGVLLPPRAKTRMNTWDKRSRRPAVAAYLCACLALSHCFLLLPPNVQHGHDHDHGQHGTSNSQDSLHTLAVSKQLRLAHSFHRGSSIVPDIFVKQNWNQDELMAHASKAGTRASYTVVAKSPNASPLLQQQGVSANHATSSSHAAGALLPDPRDVNTVRALAYMTLDCYAEPEKQPWVPIDGWNASMPFGWDSDGMRGYVFKSDDDELLVITFKGTSASVFGIGGGPTSRNDKYNDNMMFSCCCARVDRTWTPICDCCTSTQSCSKPCVDKQANFSSSYYNMAEAIYLQVRIMYPQSTIWFAGHSLGGALAALIAFTNGSPAFAYEAPGDVLYASRLGLLPPPRNSDSVPDYSWLFETLPIYHYGNAQDPIFLGVCKGVSSSCYYGGYALETGCHIGKTCLYDPDEYERQDVGAPRKVDAPRRQVLPWEVRQELRNDDDDDIGTRHNLDIRMHSIVKAIEVYFDKWDYVPECKVEKACQDCANWEYVD
ncbi:hypothetical protein SeLEV6574_g02099 [Synchytrium endobioticum]|nr:hypothetical protein SeLEV6574_g02074 [Synchytrium endobioticum]TPX48340.1 hypothetical protein SeLEV6574_g02099 [Synchytrium endobioticum]